jgi:hypothetical protein
VTVGWFGWLIGWNDAQASGWFVADLNELWCFGVAFSTSVLAPKTIQNHNWVFGISLAIARGQFLLFETVHRANCLAAPQAQ